MKFLYQNVLALGALAFLLTSCTDDSAPAAVGEGTLNVEFDNAFGDNDLILGAQPYTTSQGEVLQIGTVKYIVSNIVLTTADGDTYAYPKAQGYFIVDESDAASRVLSLPGIPAGDYVKIRFGIGVDQQQYERGAEGQGDFLALAQAEDMLWSWSAGYKFVAFEGTFTSPTVPTATPFMVHTGRIGGAYNYTEITLELPTRALVRRDITPQIHLIADVSKIIDGPHYIGLTDHNTGGMGAMIMGGPALPLITANLSAMFFVDHVHND